MQLMALHYIVHILAFYVVLITKTSIALSRPEIELPGKSFHRQYRFKDPKLQSSGVETEPAIPKHDGDYLKGSNTESQFSDFYPRKRSPILDFRKPKGYFHEDYPILDYDFHSIVTEADRANQG